MYYLAVSLEKIRKHNEAVKTFRQGLDETRQRLRQLIVEDSSLQQELRRLASDAERQRRRSILVRSTRGSASHVLNALNYMNRRGQEIFDVSREREELEDEIKALRILKAKFEIHL